MQRSNLIIEPNNQKSPTIKSILSNGNSNIFSPGTNGNEKPLLMTRRELTDPFGSDEEDEKVNSKTKHKSPPSIFASKELISPPAIDNVCSQKIFLIGKFHLKI